MVTASGATHRHLGANPNGSSPHAPINGLYLIPMELVESSGSIEKSDPFFVLYNKGLTDEQADAAYA